MDLLQALAQPALEDFTANADQGNLERVRRIKTSHQRLMNRVTLVRDAMERIMGEWEEVGGVVVWGGWR